MENEWDELMSLSQTTWRWQRWVVLAAVFLAGVVCGALLSWVGLSKRAAFASAPSTATAPSPPTAVPSPTPTVTPTPSPSPTATPAAQANLASPTPTPAPRYWVHSNAGVVNLRREPNLGENVLAQLPNGTLVLATGETVEQGGWSWTPVVVPDQGLSGWIVTDLLLSEP